MPICNKCNGVFKNRMVIDGVERNLQNRKYCLECSPRGQHNTRKLCNDEVPVGTCKICDRKFNYNKKAGHTTTMCNSCSVTKRRNKVKKMAVEHLGGKCICCGYNKSVSALDFHHKDPKEKDFGISARGHSRSWQRVKNEIDKCVLLCANCHREVHAGEREIVNTIPGSPSGKAASC